MGTYSSQQPQNRKRLQVLQYKGLRCALDKGIEANTCELHSEAKLLKLKHSGDQHVLNFMYGKSRSGESLKNKVENGVLTRSQKKTIMRIRQPKTEKYKKSLAYRGPKEWNDLPVELHLAQDRTVFNKLVADRLKLKAQKTA